MEDNQVSAISRAEHFFSRNKLLPVELSAGTVIAIPQILNSGGIQNIEKGSTISSLQNLCDEMTSSFSEQADEKGRFPKTLTVPIFRSQVEALEELKRGNIFPGLSLRDKIRLDDSTHEVKSSYEQSYLEHTTPQNPLRRLRNGISKYLGR